MPIIIHNREYKTVSERLGEIGDKLKGVDTEVLYLDPVVMVKATITTDKGIFTGISAADPSKSIEAKTPVEVAETSAVGRALAFAGYAGSEIASANEMEKIPVSSPKPTTATKEAELDDLTATCKVHGDPLIQAVSNKTGNPYWYHMMPNGDRCWGK